MIDPASSACCIRHEALLIGAWKIATPSAALGRMPI
jgi:hypothetical protein